MKTLLLLSFAILAGGCATTRIEVTTPEGLHVRASFPKNMDATGLVLKVAGHSLSAEHLRTDASSVVKAQGDIASDVAKAAVQLH